METPRLDQAYRELASRIVAKLKQSVPVRTGRLRDSIRATVNEQGVVTDIIVEGESYFKYLTGQPPQNRMERREGPTASASMRPSAGMSPILASMDKKEPDLFDGNNLAEALQDDGLEEIERIMNELFD